MTLQDAIDRHAAAVAAGGLPSITYQASAIWPAERWSEHVLRFDRRHSHGQARELAVYVALARLYGTAGYITSADTSLVVEVLP